MTQSACLSSHFRQNFDQSYPIRPIWAVGHTFHPSPPIRRVLDTQIRRQSMKSWSWVDRAQDDCAKIGGPNANLNSVGSVGGFRSWRRVISALLRRLAQILSALVQGPKIQAVKLKAVHSCAVLESRGTANCKTYFGRSQFPNSRMLSLQEAFVKLWSAGFSFKKLGSSLSTCRASFTFSLA
jgi:hypothetical protein